MKTGCQFRRLALGIVAASLPLHTDLADAKRQPGPEPELRIVEVTASPEPYVPGQGLLDLAIQVELPHNLDGATLLEVSSLISSPSKRSIRFLNNRQPLATASSEQTTSAQQAEGKPRVRVMLTWDGRDQTTQLVEKGRYNYEARAKLLITGEKGPRTLMVSWPKRGVIAVK
jgi:hypothetical protein